MTVDSNSVTKEIKIACESVLIGGFDEYYRSLVDQFIQRNDIMNYAQFVNETGRATLPIAGDDLAFCYSVAYEASHRAIFGEVLVDELIIDSSDTIMNIIDYGCGQGVATITILEYIASKQNASEIQLNIHLIEPSEVALNNACYKIDLWAKRLEFKSVNVNCQNRTLGEAVLPDIDNTGDVLHLMSYILDIPQVQSQLDNICQQILTLPNNNFVIATSPDIPASDNGFESISNKLHSKNQSIYKYRTEHESYRWIKRCYETHIIQAIGMMISLNH